MRPKHTILKRAIHKSSKVSNTKRWCGYFTPTEIMALINNGAKPHECFDIDHVKSKIKNGISNPTWFYFYPNGIVMNNE